MKLGVQPYQGFNHVWGPIMEFALPANKRKGEKMHGPEVNMTRIYGLGHCITSAVCTGQEVTRGHKGSQQRCCKLDEILELRIVAHRVSNGRLGRGKYNLASR